MGIKIIETRIQVEGREGVTLSTTTTQDEPLKRLVADHIRYLENWVAAQREEHPLGGVFANVPISFRGAEERAKDSGNPKGIDVPLARSLSAVGNGGDSAHWVRVAVGWAAVRLIKMGRYKTLSEVLEAAIEQATKGKGKGQRHGGDKTPFLEQPWVRLYNTHGLGFLLGQADKKYQEALGKEKEDDMVREILGAIVYLGMALLVLEGKVK